MKEKVTVFCYTDVHNQQALLDYPAKVRKSLYLACELAEKEFGKADLAIMGGDNVSDYPHWDRSCALPKTNFLDLKEKMVKAVADSTVDGKALYVAGNNDMILGDIGGEDWKPYNTTEFYYTGPMIEKLGELPESEKYEVTSVEKPWEYPYLDAFHYVIEGYDFVGINIDPNTAYNTHDGYYTDETLDWVKKKLDEIDPDGVKPVFVVGHLSAQCYTNGEWIECMCERSVKKFYETLDGHKNLFYLYGHNHGEGYVYRDYSSGAVVHVGEDGHTIDDNLARTDSSSQPAYKYSLVHMGGLRPFNIKYFDDDGIDGYGGESERKHFPYTANPKLSQYLVMEIYPDRVVFTVRNTGSYEGYSQSDKPEPYTVFFQK